MFAEIRRRLGSNDDHGQLAVTAMLLLATLTAVGSVAFRGFYSGRETYFFLFKDLLLAWVPIALGWALTYCMDMGCVDMGAKRLGSRVLLMFLLGAWILFLPNAPYLLTEFVHLNSQHKPHNMRLIPAVFFSQTRPVPIWYDAFMILLFAWTGSLSSFLSFRMAQRIIQKRMGRAWAWVGVVLLIVLSGFGVTLGRFQRFNSWDILTRPTVLLADTASRVFRPFAHPRTTGATLMLSIFLIITYVTMTAMMTVCRDQAQE